MGEGRGSLLTFDRIALHLLHSRGDGGRRHRAPGDVRPRRVPVADPTEAIARAHETELTRTILSRMPWHNEQRA